MTWPVYPELVHGRRDGFEQGAWSVESGSVLRGGASCNLTERSLRVPVGSDDVSRVVRAHELMHIRVSPYLREHSTTDPDILDRAMECAEEFRVNTLLTMRGFDAGLLRDGTERSGGQRLAQLGQWGEATCFFLAVLSTGAEAAFLRGIRSSRPTWVAGLRAIKKRVLAIVEGLDAAQIGDTTLDEDGVPAGFHVVTMPIARLLSRTMTAVAPEDSDALRALRRSLEPGGRRAPSAVFAPLVFDETMTYAARQRRRVYRRARPAQFGTVMRYPSRLLIDPMQRAFAHKVPATGGVIVIDQSGSMDVTVEELDELLRSAPDALIVGYSHRPGDVGVTPNAWVLAVEGRVASQVRTGNIGNGVDGPVLQWAVRSAQPREPVIWVTDGQVTDSHDHPCHSLSVECAVLVRRHRIQLVHSLSEVESALRGRRVAKGNFGRVGRELRASQRV